MSKQHDTLLCAISSFEERYGIAYPSVAKLAQCTGLTELEVAATIKELVEKGRITKKARYDNRTGRRISNEYAIIEPPTDEPPGKSVPPADEKRPIDDKAQNGYPKKSFKEPLIFKKEDLNNIARERPKLSHESHANFQLTMHEHKLPHELFLGLFDYEYLRDTLKGCKGWHIEEAVKELKFRLSVRHTIYNLGRWFNKVLENCRIKDIAIGAA